MTYEALLRFLKAARWEYNITVWLYPEDRPTFYDYVTRPGGAVSRYTLSAHGISRDNIKRAANFATL
jgi:hypothetical protein